MQTLATGNKRISHGFTLMEILIVMLCIGIVFSFMALSIKVNKTQQLNLNELSYRLYNSLLIARDNAAMQSTPFSAIINHTDYQLFELSKTSAQRFRWVPSQSPKSFSHFTFPENFYAKFEKKTKAPSLQTQLTPDIVFFPNGELTPFVLIIYADENQQLFHRIEGYRNGEIKLHQS